MTDFFDIFSSAFHVIWDDPLLRGLLGLSVSLFAITFSFRFILAIFDIRGGPDFLFLDFVVGFFEWLGDKIVTLMCRSQRGFELAYKLGWARPGIDFFDCGVHCDTCPKYAECNSDMRVLFDDVTHAEDSGTGSCS